MIKIFNTVILFLALVALFASCDSTTSSNQESEDGKTKPNVIFVLADDLGYGDLSCYGQTKFATPNIDRLAKRGMVFTQHYSGSTVCAPSRSTLLTGMHTGHTPIRGNQEVRPEGQYPLADSAMTLSELFKDAGYATGAFGKWGLGYPGSEGAPENQGFDQFYGYNCQRLAHHYYPYYLWDNDQVDSLPENRGKSKGTYAPERIHEKSLAFLDAHKDEPFFLYYPTAIPHAELVAPEAYMDKYRNKFLPEKSFKGLDSGEYYRQGSYESQPEAHAAFAAMVDLLDHQVGELLDHLEALGLTDNTVVIFTSDNGPHQEGGADPEYFDSNGPLKGFKRDLYEGGIRVPLIVSWPGVIPEGSKTDHISAFWDFFPTFGEMIGNKDFFPTYQDGISLLPTLLNKDNQADHAFLYWEFHERGGRQAIRKGKWKAVRYDVFKDPSQTPELYDLSTDVSESTNLAKQFPEQARELGNLMDKSRSSSPIFTFDQKKNSRK